LVRGRGENLIGDTLGVIPFRRLLSPTRPCPRGEILEARGIEVLLVNARHVKGVPGRKSDILDCQWLQQLHSFGLLRGSFRPDAPIAALRSLVRHRDQLIQAAAAYIQRMQKALVLMNLQLHHVLSDITGVTGLVILREIVAGQTDPARLARHRHPRCRATEAEIAAALTGHYRDEHRFVLRQALELYDVHQEKIRSCDEKIETQLRALEANCAPPDTPLPQPVRVSTSSKPREAARLRRPPAPHVEADLRDQLERGIGSDPGQLGQIHDLTAEAPMSRTSRSARRWKRCPGARGARAGGLSPREHINGGCGGRSPRVPPRTPARIGALESAAAGPIARRGRSAMRSPTCC
jgi:hypothetical protein